MKKNHISIPSTKFQDFPFQLRRISLVLILKSVNLLDGLLYLPVYTTTWRHSKLPITTSSPSLITNVLCASLFIEHMQQEKKKG